MKKISLINTLKKTFKTKKKLIKKKNSKTTSKLKKTKISVKTKKLKSTLKTKKIKTQSKVNKSVKSKPLKVDKKENPESNTGLLRIPKNNEQKPEIKKVKKQETEKKEYKVKDYVVYPKHGVGQITEFKKMNIGGIDIETPGQNLERDPRTKTLANGMQPNVIPTGDVVEVKGTKRMLKSKSKKATWY